MKNKKIVVKWMPENSVYEKAMIVTKSSHPRKYKVGMRFDYGFVSVASDAGFQITILPLSKKLKK